MQSEPRNKPEKKALEPEDSRFFVERLLKPSEPSELPELQKAIADYQQGMET